MWDKMERRARGKGDEKNDLSLCMLVFYFGHCHTAGVASCKLQNNSFKKYKKMCTCVKL